MNVLAIETATPVLGCCLWAGNGPVASMAFGAGGHHGEVLLPMVDELFSRAGLDVADLDAVVVDHGPGLFTGLRVGLSVAGAISDARLVPCVGISSLNVLAHPHRRRSGLVAAIVDARRGEVYWSLYYSDGAVLSSLRGPKVAAPGTLADELAALDGAVLAVGDGAWRYRGVLAEACVELAGPTDMAPRPDVLAELGVAELEAGHGRRGTPQALYLRQADVRIGWDQVGGRVGPDGLMVP